MLPIFFLVAVGLQMPASAQTVLHYRYEAKNTSTLDLTAFEKGTEVTNSSTFALLSVTMRDSAEGKLAHVVIDSIVRADAGAKAQASVYLTPEMLASGKGATYDLYLVDGQMWSYVWSMPGNLDAAAVSGAVDLMFPALSRSIKVGRGWSDTLTTKATPTTKESSKDVTTWTLKSRDTLTAVLTTSKTADLGEEWPSMTTEGAGTAKVVLDAARTVVSATMTMHSEGAMGNARIKGVSTSTLTRVP